MIKTIRAVIYGDSIMNGTVLDPTQKYISIMAENLKKFCAAFGIEAKNRSRYGLTVEQGKKMLDYDIQKGLDCDYALVEFGGNDCNYRWSEISQEPTAVHLPRTCLDRFREVYQSMIGELHKAGIRPILMTLPPLDAERYLAYLGCVGNDCKRILSWLGDVNMIYRFHEYYSNAVEKIAQKTGALLVDVRAYFLDKHNFRDLICEDGVHPNEEGHKLLFRAFEDFVRAELSLT